MSTDEGRGPVVMQGVLGERDGNHAPVPLVGYSLPAQDRDPGLLCTSGPGLPASATLRGMSPSPPCPDCGHTKVLADFACHTWPGGLRADGTEQWMSCANCGSAIEYLCGCWLDDEVPNPDDPGGMWIYREPDCQCDWRYTHGLNPNNPRFAKQQEYRPVWLEPEPDYSAGGDILKHPDVRWIGATEEDQ